MKIKGLNKRAQEEMVGFAMIIIIVAVIMLILLGIALNKPKTNALQSYEVESFVSASLQHTTGCSTDTGRSYNDVANLITECDFEQVCTDGRTACDVLSSELGDILEGSWRPGQDSPIKGYVFNITADDNNILSLSKGNETSNYKAGLQPLQKKGTAYDIEFRVYY